MLDHDDVLTPNALYEAVKAVNEQGVDFVYSDEIVLDSTLKKLGEYHFKPDFSPDTLRGCNYITHLAVFSRALLAAAGGGERAEFDLSLIHIFIMGDNAMAVAKGVETFKIAVALAVGIVLVLALPGRLFEAFAPCAGKKKGER